MADQTASNDLVAFVRARRDEDEAAARQAASESPWRVSDTHDDGTRSVKPADAPDGLWHGDVAVHIAGSDARHIARHDPARVLREVEAKRRLIDDYLDLVKSRPPDRYAPAGEPDATWAMAECIFRVLCRDAAIWRDHPDYRQEWKP